MAHEANTTVFVKRTRWMNHRWLSAHSSMNSWLQVKKCEKQIRPVQEHSTWMILLIAGIIKRGSFYTVMSLVCSQCWLRPPFQRGILVMLIRACVFEGELFLDPEWQWLWISICWMITFLWLTIMQYFVFYRRFTFLFTIEDSLFSVT